MSHDLLTYRGTVYPWHCDHMGHMNVMWYVGKFDETTSHLLASQGLMPKSLRAAHRGMVAVEQALQYKRDLLAGDLVTVHSRILGLTEKSIRFAHEMHDEETGAVAAAASSVSAKKVAAWCCIRRYSMVCSGR